MRAPVLWLKKYIPISVTAEKLADDLTMSGTKLESLEKKGGEYVLDLEITSNRSDCLSLIGIAREISSLYGKKISEPKIKSSQKPSEKSAASFFKIEIHDKKGCPLYTARLIQNVAIKSAPAEIRQSLELAGIRAINNAVDATNFVLLETGQPLHAFDYDKLAGHKIVVRRAFKNEKFLGLDGIEYTLDDSILVIADAEKAVAIAGVMGGKLTEVTDNTKNILLESAYFDPILVRHACRKTKISTESGYRFERKIDLQGVAAGSARAADLILEWAGGKEAVFSEIRTIKNEKQKTIRIHFDSMKTLIGMAIPESRISGILKNLGFEVKKAMGGLTIGVPSWRCDIHEEADIVEEVLRIEGFDKVKPAIPITHYNAQFKQDLRPESVFALKKYLAALGFSEIMTYSLLSSKVLEMSGYDDFSLVQKIKNPISAEQEYFRPGLLPGALASVLFNVHRKAESLKFFEIGNCYVGGKEKSVLSLLLYGSYENNWLRKSAFSVFDLKGAAENLLQGFFKLEEFSWEEEKNQSFKSGFSLNLGGKKAGVAGEIKGSLLKHWDIPQSAYFAEIDLDEIWPSFFETKELKVKPVSKYPLVRRDIAFLVDKSVPVAALQEVMREAGSGSLKETRLFDEYSGKNIPSNKRSLAFSLSYQKNTATFTDEEIQTLQNAVGQALKNKFHVEFR